MSNLVHFLYCSVSGRFPPQNLLPLSMAMKCNNTWQSQDRSNFTPLCLLNLLLPYPSFSCFLALSLRFCNSAVHRTTEKFPFFYSYTIFPPNKLRTSQCKGLTIVHNCTNFIPLPLRQRMKFSIGLALFKIPPHAEFLGRSHADGKNWCKLSNEFF